MVSYRPSRGFDEMLPVTGMYEFGMISQLRFF